MPSLPLTNRIKYSIAALAICVIALLSLPTLAGAQPAPGDEFKGELCGGANFSLRNDSCANPCVERASDGSCADRQAANSGQRINRIVTTVVNILSTIVAVVAVIFIIVAGFRFVTSGGDSGKIATARTTVIYAIVGLLVVALAQVIVRFVLSRVTD